MTDDISRHTANSPPDLLLAWMRWCEGLLINNQMPLSGNVTQWIDVWGRAVGQVGLLNVNLQNSSDPATEQAIGRQYSYGRQLGRILDVLEPIVKDQETRLAAQGPGMQEKLADFNKMVADIEGEKQRRRVPLDRMLHTLQAMRGDHPASHHEVFDAALRSLQDLQTLLEAPRQR